MTQVSGTFPGLSDGRRKSVVSPIRARVGKALKDYRAGSSAAQDRAQAVRDAQDSPQPGPSQGRVLRPSPAPAGMAVRRERARNRAHGKA